jgi:hypothetical protein
MYCDKLKSRFYGINWTAITNSIFGTSQAYGIAYGNGKFVVGDASGKMAYSTGL